MPTTPFIGWITPFGCNFAPRGWSKCGGQLLSISAHQSLFSLIGTAFGGNARHTFGLPDLRGRVALGAESGGTYVIGATGGAESVTLTENLIPSHTHSAQIPVSTGIFPSPTDRDTGFMQGDGSGNFFGKTAGTGVMKGTSLVSAGSNQAHNNQQPYQVLNYCIALQGVYPSRQ